MQRIVLRRHAADASHAPDANAHAEHADAAVWRWHRGHREHGEWYFDKRIKHLFW
jgi:hypothetical protein